jgi:hypothetical protein
MAISSVLAIAAIQRSDIIFHMKSSSAIFGGQIISVVFTASDRLEFIFADKHKTQ